MKQWLQLSKETFARYGADNCSTYASAIAYATVFAIAPLIIVVIAIAGTLIGVTNGGHGHHIVENQLIHSLQGIAGARVADMVRTLVDTNFSSRQGSVIAQILGWITFLLAASNLFLTLQSALNVIWRAKPKESGLWLTIRNRLSSGLMLIVLGAVVLLAIAINIATSFVLAHMQALLPFPAAAPLATVISHLISILVFAMVFAAIYRTLPDAEVSWRDVAGGSIATAVLFVVGQVLLGVYLSHAGVSTGYGAAGSLVVLLIWVYYSSLLFLIGAEFTRVFAEEHGSLASQQAARDADPQTRGATQNTSDGATVGSASKTSRAT